MMKASAGLKIFHAAFITFMLAPLVVVGLVAFTPEGYLAVPTTRFSLRWFWAISDNKEFVDAFWVSLYLAVVSASLSLLVTLPAALAIARYRFIGRDLMNGLLMSPLMIPTVVLGVAFLRFLTAVDLTSTFTGLVLCHFVIVTPFTLRMLLASITGLQRDAENAAASLGASKWQVFRRITLPLVLPGIAGGWVLAFIHSFDELTVTVFVASPSTTTLPVKLFSHIAQTTDPLVASVSVVVMAVTGIMLVILDRIYGLDRLLSGGTRKS